LNPSSKQKLHLNHLYYLTNYK